MIRVFTSKTQIVGEQGEKQAVSYLQAEKYTIVDRNISNKHGEIDIVAKKGNMYYFFEVKAGKYGGSIHPAENLTTAKIRKFMISVEYYVLTHSIKEYRAQGIIVLFKSNGEVPIEIIDLT